MADKPQPIRSNKRTYRVGERHVYVYHLLAGGGGVAGVGCDRESLIDHYRLTAEEVAGLDRMLTDLARRRAAGPTGRAKYRPHRPSRTYRRPYDDDLGDKLDAFEGYLGGDDEVKEVVVEVDVAGYKLIRQGSQAVVLDADGQVLAQKEIKNACHWDNFVAKFRQDEVYRREIVAGDKP